MGRAVPGAAVGSAAMSIIAACSLTVPDENDYFGGIAENDGGGATSAGGVAGVAGVSGGGLGGGRGGNGATAGSGGTSGLGGSGGTSGCAVGTKPCAGNCVSVDDPSYGCGSSDCSPCALPQATATCASGQCRVLSCSSGYLNCDSNHANGCEVTPGDVSHCGSCGKACSSNHAAPVCNAGTCTLTCSSGWGDCNSQASDGCETDLQYSDAHCDACGKSCGTGIACRNGNCVISNCPAGMASLGILRPVGDVDPALWADVPSFGSYYTKVDDAPSHDGTSTYIWDDSINASTIWFAAGPALPSGKNIAHVSCTSAVRMTGSGSATLGYRVRQGGNTFALGGANFQGTVSNFIIHDDGNNVTLSSSSPIEIGLDSSRSQQGNPIEVTQFLCEVCVQ